MKTIDTVAKVADRIIWAVGCFTIMGFAHDHWPVAYQVATGAFLLGFGVWYLWRYLVQPFRTSLRGS